jgi:membrane protein implicated in regulation of membrane protease activity
LSVRVSPISKTAALLIIAVGAFVLVAGVTTGEILNTVAGTAFLVLGVSLYLLLLRFTRNLQSKIDEAQKA